MAFSSPTGRQKKKRVYEHFIGLDGLTRWAVLLGLLGTSRYTAYSLVSSCCIKTSGWFFPVTVAVIKEDFSCSTAHYDIPEGI